MGTQVYEVPIIFHGLRGVESYLQLIDSLDNLNHIVDDVYSRISGRVATEKAKIDSLSQRLAVAQSKVQQITSSTKAITVFSSAKYPAPPLWPDYVPIYADATLKEPKVSSYHLRDVPLSPPSNEDSLEGEELLFLEKGSVSSKLQEVGAVEGLGRLPQRIPSVSTLLLFNSRENPFKKYVRTDNLDVGEAVAKGNVAGKTLGAAPESVSKGDYLVLPGVMEYGYKPQLVDVPELTLPLSIPNLPNVADNLTWSGTSADLGGGIAPSQKIPSLPSFDASTPPTGAPVSAPAPAPGAPAPPPPSAAPPPPPPGPAAPPPPPPTHAPPPPPGPPPPGPLPPSVPVAVVEPARNSLLEDIRKGHKNRLKKVKSEGEDGEEETPKKKGKKAAASSSGDMFSDLITALNRRREGIAAKAKKQSSKRRDDDEIKGPPPEGDDSDKDWED